MASPQIAFVPETRVAWPRLAEGPLSGLTFAAKDVFAVRGHVSSAGHPAWARTHQPAAQHAAVVQRLLEAGADLIGVTILDELAYGLVGENPHYGTPQNPRAEGYLCGGSSSGSAAAVAAGLCDFAIGTDTAGSVRVPAALCGIYGLRPSHGALSTEGVVPLAPSFDTVGFLARDGHTFSTVASALFESAPTRPIERVLIAEDALSLCDAGISELLGDVLSRALTKLGVPVERVQVAPQGFTQIREALRRLQAHEAWLMHGDWVQSTAPRFSPGVEARFEMARRLAESGESLELDDALRNAVITRLRSWLTPGTLLFIPPTPGAAPQVGASTAELEAFRARTLELTALASLAGVPQLVLPTPDLAGLPLGLSFIAYEGGDGWLSQLARPLERALAG